MKNNSESEELLHDIVEDAAPAAFRAGLLDKMLHEVQRHKHTRQRNRRLVVVACIVAALGLVARFLPLRSHPRSAAPDPLTVHSQPLEPVIIVATKPGGVDIIKSSPNTVAWVRAPEQGKLFEVVGDGDLLSLLAGHPAALVRRGPGQAELVFVNPADQNGFPVP